MAMDIGQPEISPLVMMNELFVIHAHEMKNGCLQVMYMDRVFGNVVTMFIG